ncbi:MAG: Ku protein [Tepidisphaeraceae bacterium]|jgi:DNA end-binding protein Ku
MSRPIWTGSLNFGLVNIGVEMIMAVHEKAVHFHMLSKDGHCRLRRKLVCPDTGKEYDFADTARGIEVGPNEYAVVEQKEIDQLKPEKGKALEIVQFTDLTAIDPVYFDRVYFLKPVKESSKSYKLLLDVMREENKCAIARFVMREREYLAAIRALEDGMTLHTLHYADEVESLSDEVGAGLGRIKTTSAEMKMASELMKTMTKSLDLDEFKDEYRLRLQKMIDAKVKGKEVQHIEAEEEGPPPRTINLMEALKKSLAAGNARGDGHGRRRSA